MQALIADLLLRAGRDPEADEEWLQAEREDPRNPWVNAAAGAAEGRVARQGAPLADQRAPAGTRGR